MNERLAYVSIRGAAAAAILAIASCGGEVRTADVGNEASAAERMLLPTADSGLQVRHWRVSDDPGNPDRVVAALMRYAAPLTSDPPDQDRLAQNGFMLVPVALDALAALQAELNTSRDVEGWYGQAYGWRTVAEVRLDAGARTVAIDGRVGRMEGGRLRLVVRGWTMPMEDGPAMYVQVVPEHDRTPSTRLAQALGRRAFVGDRFPDAGIELMMTPDTAWVLTAVGPAATPLRGLASAAEEDVPTGPDVETPPTVGALLLRREDRSAPQHDLLVFVPMIPDSLAPLPLARSGGNTMDDADPGFLVRRTGS